MVRGFFYRNDLRARYGSGPCVLRGEYGRTRRLPAVDFVRQTGRQGQCTHFFIVSGRSRAPGSDQTQAENEGEFFELLKMFLFFKLEFFFLKRKS